MLVLYFCLNDSPAVVRCWAAVPRIGDTVALPELGGNINPLRVYDVIWEGSDEPSVNVYVHHAKVEHPSYLAPKGARHFNGAFLAGDC